MLTDSLNEYPLRLKLKEKEIAHMLLPRENVIFSYVVENRDTKQITDLISFYRLPSSILKKSGHSYDQVNVISHNVYFYRLLIHTTTLLKAIVFMN